jgi:hypothetical protein
MYSHNRSAYSAAGNMLTDPEKIKIGTEAAKFLEKEYINGILVAVYRLIGLAVQKLSHLIGIDRNSKY